MVYLEEENCVEFGKVGILINAVAKWQLSADRQVAARWSLRFLRFAREETMQFVHICSRPIPHLRIYVYSVLGSLPL
jgi:hypothetical protein